MLTPSLSYFLYLLESVSVIRAITFTPPVRPQPLTGISTVAPVSFEMSPGSETEAKASSSSSALGLVRLI